MQGSTAGGGRWEGHVRSVGAAGQRLATLPAPACLPPQPAPCSSSELRVHGADGVEESTACAVAMAHIRHRTHLREQRKGGVGEARNSTARASRGYGQALRRAGLHAAPPCRRAAANWASAERPPPPPHLANGVHRQLGQAHVHDPQPHARRQNGADGGAAAHVRPHGKLGRRNARPRAHLPACAWGREKSGHAARPGLRMGYDDLGGREFPYRFSFSCGTHLPSLPNPPSTEQT